MLSRDQTILSLINQPSSISNIINTSIKTSSSQSMLPCLLLSPTLVKQECHSYFLRPECKSSIRVRLLLYQKLLTMIRDLYRLLFPTQETSNRTTLWQKFRTPSKLALPSCKSILQGQLSAPLKENFEAKCTSSNTETSRIVKQRAQSLTSASVVVPSRLVPDTIGSPRQATYQAATLI